MEGAADTFPPDAGSRGAGGHRTGWAGPVVAAGNTVGYNEDIQ